MRAYTRNDTYKYHQCCFKIDTSAELRYRPVPVGAFWSRREPHSVFMVAMRADAHCEPPLPAPLPPLPTVSPQCEPHFQMTLRGPTTSPTAT